MVTRAVMVMDMVAIFTVVAVVTIGPYESREALAMPMPMTRHQMELPL